MKILFTTALLICFVFTKAQVEKNTILVGSNFNFSNNNYKLQNNTSNSYSSSGGNINVSLGKAIQKNRVIGAGLGYIFYKNKGYINSPNDTIISKNKNFIFSLFYRQYKKIKNDFYLFGNGNVSFLTGYGRETYINISKIGESKSYAISSGIALGVGYPISKKLQVELSLPNILSVQYSKSKADKNVYLNPYSEVTNFNISSAFSNTSFLNNISLGFSLTL